MTIKQKINENSGFTLLEIMITVAIIGILVSISLPSFNTTIKNNRITTKANDLLVALSSARQVAISRSLVTFVCHTAMADQVNPTCGAASADGDVSDWNTGLIVYSAAPRTIVTGLRAYSATAPQDDLIQQASFNLTDNVVVIDDNAANFVGFTGNGLLFPGDNTISFQICDDRAGELGRLVSVSVSGRVSIADMVCN